MDEKDLRRTLEREKVVLIPEWKKICWKNKKDNNIKIDSTKIIDASKIFIFQDS